MTTLRIIVLLLLIFGLFWSNPVWAQSLECDDAVALRTGRITVAANGVDDTENIQCALDEAKRLRIPAVRLVSDVYFISSVQIADFKGALEGRGRDETTVVVLNDSIDCEQMLENGQHPAALKFVNGDVELQWMTVGVDRPCSRPELNLQLLLIHFTGTDVISGCENEIGFGAVSRVNLVSVAPEYLYGNPDSSPPGPSGIGAFSEAYSISGDCRLNQLGALRLERSFLGGFSWAVEVALQGSAAIDIAFNEFVNNSRDVSFPSIRQRLAIQSNTIVKTEEFNEPNSIGVLDQSPLTPAANEHVVIHNNIFSIESGGPYWLRPVWADTVIFASSLDNLSLEISSNQFGITAYWNAVILADIKNANVTNNVFQGSGGPKVWQFNHSFFENLGGANNITGNDFRGSCSGVRDIRLDEETSGNIVGPGQNATVENFGTNNYILGEFETPIKTECDISSISESEAVLAAKTRYQELNSRISALLDARHGDSG